MLRKMAPIKMNKKEVVAVKLEVAKVFCSCVREETRLRRNEVEKTNFRVRLTI